jgi:hypothetical protein
MHARAKKFCENFVRLWREERAKGASRPRVGRQAALLAGYGGKSWNERNTILAADQMYNRLVKRPDVIATLKELGLERTGEDWTDITEAGQQLASPGQYAQNPCHHHQVFRTSGF